MDAAVCSQPDKIFHQWKEELKEWSLCTADWLWSSETAAGVKTRREVVTHVRPHRRHRGDQSEASCFPPAVIGGRQVQISGRDVTVEFFRHMFLSLQNS